MITPDPLRTALRDRILHGDKAYRHQHDFRPVCSTPGCNMTFTQAVDAALAPDPDPLDAQWRSGFLRWRAVWLRTDGSLAVNMNRYATRAFEGHDPEKARSDAAASRPNFPDWNGETIVVQQRYPWDDDEAKELARAARLADTPKEATR